MGIYIDFDQRRKMLNSSLEYMYHGEVNFFKDFFFTCTLCILWILQTPDTTWDIDIDFFLSGWKLPMVNYFPIGFATLSSFNNVWTFLSSSEELRSHEE